MINVTYKENCCGCGVCEAVCPNDCIKMEYDDEGFRYPRINESNCIHCNMCEKTCPIINSNTNTEGYNLKAFIAKNKDMHVLKESTSGGVFSAIAQYVIENKGYVCGAVLNDDFSVEHKITNNYESLGSFRNSKYLQSRISDRVYQAIHNLLDAEKFVCFSGTPCQVSALKVYLGRDYDSLITVDVVCRAVPSQSAFLKYLEYMNHILETEISSIRFRDKSIGYNFSSVMLCNKNRDLSYHRGIESDPWLRAFFSNICDRPSCHKCKFRTRNRNSDITIWDCFNYKRYAKDFDGSMGASFVAIHTKKGEDLVDCLNSSLTMTIVDPNLAINSCKEYLYSVEANDKREVFFSDCNNMSGIDLFEKYFPLNTKYKIKHIMRKMLFKTGFYMKIRELYHRGKNLSSR